MNYDLFDIKNNALMREKMALEIIGKEQILLLNGIVNFRPCYKRSLSVLNFVFIIIYLP